MVLDDLLQRRVADDAVRYHLGDARRRRYPDLLTDEAARIVGTVQIPGLGDVAFPGQDITQCEPVAGSR